MPYLYNCTNSILYKSGIIMERDSTVALRAAGGGEKGAYRQLGLERVCGVRIVDQNRRIRC